jgi:hypothetical protein
MLKYTKDPARVSWECRSLSASSGSKGSDPSEDTENSKKRNIFSSKTPHHLLTAWHCVIEEYSNMKLTRNDDKLPALSGLAQQVQPLVGSMYSAGLWDSFLIRGLLLVASDPHSFLSNKDLDTHSRTATYRAPTWSWTSIDGSIDYRTHINYNTEKQSLISIKSISTTPLGQNPRGKVTAGSLTLEGYVKPLFRQTQSSMGAKQLSGYVYEDAEENGGPKGEKLRFGPVILDVPREVGEDTLVYCLFVLPASTSNILRKSMSLALVRCEENIRG